MKKYFLILIALISANCFGQLTQRQKDSIALINGEPSVYLAFNGAYITSPNWSGGIPFYVAASPISGNTAAMDSVVNLVKEIWNPFPCVITRDSSLFVIAPFNHRQMIVFTPTCTVFGCSLGSSYQNAYYIGDGTESFVNSNLATNAILRARTAAHELGHDFGLYHQNTTGGGSGQTSLRPLMNLTISATINLETWWNGINQNSENQDDVGVITYGLPNYSNGVIGIRNRMGDIGTSFYASKYLQKDKNANFFVGVNDSDYYFIEIPSTQTVAISISPLSFGASNEFATLDVAIDLYDANYTLVASSTNTTTLNASISQSLTAGRYYVKVRGDRGNPNLTASTADGKIFMGHYYLSYTY